MNKFDYVENIMLCISGSTGINFQIKLSDIFSTYYKSLGKTFEMPDYYGGDQKNDGWVVEDAVFYQIFSPTRLKNSLKKEIQIKFKEDLTELLKKVCIENKWHGNINKFVFIVNTFDNNLPEDSERYFETLVNELKIEYKCDFGFIVSNTNYVQNLLYSIDDINLLEEISSRLHVLNAVNHQGVTEKIIFELIINIANNTASKLVSSNVGTGYNRISTSDKIGLNDLGGLRSDIESIISNLDTVENAVSTINQDLIDGEKFDQVRQYIIQLYSDNSINLSGVNLFNFIVDECVKTLNGKVDLTVPVKFLIVYIFDKCDIFKKE